MQSSLHASIWPCSSASRENDEYSICSEASGCTALPRLSDSAEHSDSEIKRVLPSLTSSAMPPTLSSTGTFGSTRDSGGYMRMGACVRVLKRAIHHLTLDPPRPTPSRSNTCHTSDHQSPPQTPRFDPM